MKSIKFILIAVFAMSIVISCKKSDPAPITPEGKWNGTYTLTGGGAPNYFSMNFQSGGSLLVEANSAASPDLATGSYTLVGDSIKGTFTYTVGIGIIYNFSAGYSSGSNTMTGTIGIAPSYTNNAVFTVTRQ